LDIEVNMKGLGPTLIALLILASTSALARDEMNGFELTDSLIPIDEIFQGGPPRDGIPSIDRPTYLPARDARYLRDDELVLGLVHNGIARAYPIRILVWHEIVNAEFDGEPVVITFCPLCGTGLAFSAVLDRRRLDFGVSGLLHNSDLLMYDRQTESLWTQIPGQAVTGDMAGKSLQRLAVVHLPWRVWREQFPNGKVLSSNTGFDRDYSRDPYAGYDRTNRLLFPVSKSDARYTAKTWVLGLESDGLSKAWPFPELAKTDGNIVDTFAGQQIEIRFDSSQQTASAHDMDGNLLPAVRAFWFAWYGFYPDTEIYNAERE
jgi:hypothetical protein